MELEDMISTDDAYVTGMQIQFLHKFQAASLSLIIKIELRSTGWHFSLTG